MSTAAALEFPNAAMSGADPSSVSSPSPRRRRAGRWLLLFLALAATPLLLAGGAALYLVNCLRLSSTTDSLRSVVVHHSGGGWRTQFFGGVGWLPLTVARTGLLFVHEAPSEARLALAAVRGGEAAVYQRSRPAGPADFTQLLAAADQVMRRDGWERAAGVVDGGQCVGVYFPRDMTSPARAQATVFVVSENDLVIASARADLRPLMELVWSKLETEGRLPRRRKWSMAGTAGL